MISKPPSSPPLARHVLAALASGAQAKPAGVPPARPVAAHLQAALAAVQARLPVEGRREGRPVAAHIAAALSRPAGSPVQRALAPALASPASTPNLVRQPVLARPVIQRAAATFPAEPSPSSSSAAFVVVGAKELTEFELAARQQNQSAGGAQNAILRLTLLHDEGSPMMTNDFTHEYSLLSPGKHSEVEVTTQAVLWLKENAAELESYTLHEVELFTRKNPCPACSQYLCGIPDTLGKVVGVSGRLALVLAYTDALYIQPGKGETVEKWQAIKAQNDSAFQKCGWLIRQVQGFR